MSSTLPCCRVRIALAATFALCVTGCSATRLMIENDVGGLGGSDRYYTSGLKLEGTLNEHPFVEAAVDPIREALRRFKVFPAIGGYYPSQDESIAVGIGQQIFTPEDLTRSDVIVTDRPYAGYLYTYGALLNFASTDPLPGSGPAAATGSPRFDRLDSFELQLGYVGPNSGAEDTQTQVHEVIGSQDPKGWNNQLKNEFMVQLAITRQIRHDYEELEWLDAEYDIITNYAARLGTVHTNAQVGAAVRTGWNLPRDFAVDTTTPRIRVESPEKYFYAFLGVDGRFVARNIFLDGNLFRSSPHDVDSERFVADFKLGIAFTVCGWEIGLTQFARTPEFRRTSDPQLFGALTVSRSY